MKHRVFVTTLRCDGQCRVLEVEYPDGIKLRHPIRDELDKCRVLNEYRRNQEESYAKAC
ncbi:MAG: hypothetical protein AAGA75_24155 [Cyanobacteria bacterium P01_E01_bin.6]